MTIADVYAKYQIMPSLQLHMLRVAGVAEWIVERLGASHPIWPDRENIVKTCLLHDLGNIAKFDLEYFPEFLQPEGLAYWQKVKAATVAKYGSNAHQATVKMVGELAVESRIVELIDAVSFDRAQTNYLGTDFAAKICAYADMRVAPEGVTSLEERLADGFKRYEQRGAGAEFSRTMGGYIKQIERQLEEMGGFEAGEVVVDEENVKHFLSLEI